MPPFRVVRVTSAPPWLFSLDRRQRILDRSGLPLVDPLYSLISFSYSHALAARITETDCRDLNLGPPKASDLASAQVVLGMRSRTYSIETQDQSFVCFGRSRKAINLSNGPPFMLPCFRFPRSYEGFSATARAVERRAVSGC